MKKLLFRLPLFLLLLSIISCTISPGPKEYAVESDFFSGEITVHEGPGVKDYFNLLDRETYYGRVDAYGFSHASDEDGKPIEIRFANNNIAYLSGYTDYRLPVDLEKMVEIEENYGSPDDVESKLIRNALEKAAFNAGQFMNVFDALGQNRAYLQELIFDQANFGQYQVKWKEEFQTDVATGKEIAIKVSDRIPCSGGDDLCINGYMRTEPSALLLYDIKLFNFTVKNLKGSDNVETAIAANLERSNKMEELAIEARESQVRAVTTVENAKASVTEKQAEKEIAVAEAEKETALAQEKLKQEKLLADAILYKKQKEAEGDRLKRQAGLDPKTERLIAKDESIGVARELAKRPVPMIISNGGNGQLEQAYSTKEMLLLMNQIQNRK